MQSVSVQCQFLAASHLHLARIMDCFFHLHQLNHCLVNPRNRSRIQSILYLLKGLDHMHSELEKNRMRKHHIIHKHGFRILRKMMIFFSVEESDVQEAQKNAVTG